MQMEYVLAAFRSRQQVQQFREMLRGTGIPAEVVNTPHRIAMGCGVSVRFPADALDRAREIYESRCRESHTSFVGFYGVYHARGRLETVPLYRRFLQ